MIVISNVILGMRVGNFFYRVRYAGIYALAVVAVCSGFIATTQIVYAAPDPTLVGGSAVIGYSGTPAPITDLQVSGTGNPTVPVKLLVTNGSLSMTTTTGLTFTGSSTGSTLQFSGSLTDVNTALATLRYTRTGTGTDTLEASLVNAGEVFLPSNGHLYEYVSFTATWGNAKTNAESRTKYNATGYLTTITSQTENDFVSARLLNAGWMGAADSGSEGAWRWMTGPENGTQFWSGTSGGSTVGGNYANWGSGEPNDFSSNEDCAQFLTGGTGKWNDLPCTVTTLPGYVVEYGSDGSPLEVASKNVSLTTLAANQYPSTPTSLGPTSSVNASWQNDNTPTFSFSLSDPDAGNTVKYQIQIDNNMDFSSPVVNYTSALAAQGARSFTVGQAAGSGSYATGSSGQTLTDAQYYWRVRAIDNVDAASSYIAANSGNIAFRIDTGTPSTPPTPTTTTPNSDTTPTWSWDDIDDMMSGFGTLELEWSQTAGFTSGVMTDDTDWPSFSSFTHTTPLSDGTWYFRTRATDAAGNISGYSASGSVLIDTIDPTVPGTPTATSPSTTNKPTWTWTASTDSGAGLSLSQPYAFEFSQDESFGSYTRYNSVMTNSFTHTNALADGTWYARVIAYDKLSHSANSLALGSVVIDTTAPTMPENLISTSLPPNHRPTITWTASTDAGTGLAHLAYTLEWSSTADFSSDITTVTTPTASYAFSTDLPDGKWYFRVRAHDVAGNMTAFSTIFSQVISTPVPQPAVTQTAQPVAPLGGVAEDISAEDALSPALDELVLNVFDTYTDGSGKQLSLQPGHVIYFYLNEEKHSITVKEVGGSYVVVTIASTPTDVRVDLGSTRDYDTDHNGTNDISIALQAIDGTSATMTFRQLAAVVPTAESPAPPKAQPAFNWWPMIIFVGVTLSIAAVIIRLRTPKK